MLADTSFIIDIMEGLPAAVGKATRLEREGVAISVCSPTVFELYVGVSRAKRPSDEAERILETIGSLSEFTLDHQAAIAAAEILEQKRRDGILLDPEDAMIAGIARANGKSIITRNLKHFRGIKGLTVEDY